MTEPQRTRRLAPSFAASALAHFLLLVLVILLARRPIEAPKWVPPPAFSVIFEGGNTAKSSIATPHPRPKTNSPPEAEPPPAPAPLAAPAPPSPPTPAPTPAPSPPAIEAIEPPTETPPRVFIPIQPLALPSLPAEPLPRAAPPARALPSRHARSAPRRAFPAPMTFSLGGPAKAPTIQRRSGRGVELSFGQGAFGAEDTAVFGRTDSKDVGPDWFNEFSAWWERHRYYPPEAAESGEDGEVTLDLVVLRDGQVAHLALASGSGSQWLDMAALGVFRDARLPPLPSDAAPSVPIRLTIHYQIIRR